MHSTGGAEACSGQPRARCPASAPQTGPLQASGCLASGAPAGLVGPTLPVVSRQVAQALGPFSKSPVVTSRPPGPHRAWRLFLNPAHAAHLPKTRLIRVLPNAPSLPASEPWGSAHGGPSRRRQKGRTAAAVSLRFSWRLGVLNKGVVSEACACTHGPPPASQTLCRAPQTSPYQESH